MAAAPSFAALPVIGSSVVSATADTVYTAPTHAVTLLGGQGPRAIADGVLNSTTLLTSATAAFNSGDVQRPISGTGIPVGTVIQSVTSATNVVMSQIASATASSVAVALGGGSGTMVSEVVMVGAGVTVAGVINTFLLDPAAVYHMHDSFVVTAVTPGSSTAPFRLVRDYQNLWLPPGWSYLVTSWVASQLISATATGLNA